MVQKISKMQQDEEAMEPAVGYGDCKKAKCTEERLALAERRMAQEGKKKALYNASKVRSFHTVAGADTSIV